MKIWRNFGREKRSIWRTKEFRFFVLNTRIYPRNRVKEYGIKVTLYKFVKL